MKNQSFYEAVEDSPIIAAIKNQEGLERCLQSEIKVVFILFGDICNIGEIVKRVKDAGKMAMVHADLITGLSAKEISVDYLKRNTQTDGIISTKTNLIKHAKELSLFTVFRLFLIDSMALESIHRQSNSVKPDFLEILPGVMPKVIQRITKTSNAPVIAGGLILDKEDVIEALNAGAIAISTTNQEIWFM